MTCIALVSQSVSLSISKSVSQPATQSVNQSTHSLCLYDLPVFTNFASGSYSSGSSIGNPCFCISRYLVHPTCCIRRMSATALSIAAASLNRSRPATSCSSKTALNTLMSGGGWWVMVNEGSWVVDVLKFTGEGGVV